MEFWGFFMGKRLQASLTTRPPGLTVSPFGGLFPGRPAPLRRERWVALLGPVEALDPVDFVVGLSRLTVRRRLWQVGGRQGSQPAQVTAHEKRWGGVDGFKLGFSSEAPEL